MTNDILYIVPLLVAVVIEAVKKTGLLKKEWLPLASIALGIVVATVCGYFYPDQFLALLIEGVITGAAASGIYDAAKSVMSITGLIETKQK